jgi:hypothetical protein
MIARTLEGIELERDTLDGLRTRLGGVLLPLGDPDSDEGGSIWNAMIDCRPALIARYLGVVEVVAWVNCLREHGVTLSIRGRALRRLLTSQAEELTAR